MTNVEEILSQLSQIEDKASHVQRQLDSYGDDLRVLESRVPMSVYGDPAGITASGYIINARRDVLEAASLINSAQTMLARAAERIRN